MGTSFPSLNRVYQIQSSCTANCMKWVRKKYRLRLFDFGFCVETNEFVCLILSIYKLSVAAFLGCEKKKPSRSGGKEYPCQKHTGMFYIYNV